MIADISPISDSSLISAEMLSRFDELEVKLAALPSVELPVKHSFTPGLYIREIFMPKGTMVTTRIHKTEHPFVITMGSVLVISQEGNFRYAAGTQSFRGVTKPGTKRVIYVEEDCIWSTFHPTNKTDVAEIAADILLDHDNPLLTAEGKSRIVDISK